MTKQPIRRNVEFKKPGRTRGIVQKFERTFLASAWLNYLITRSGKMFLAALIWPRFVAPHRWHLTRYPMPLANLHPVFNGFTLLQLTDLHVGKTRLDYLERVFDATMGEKPGLVAITGDLIDYHPHALPQIDRLLKRLVHHPHKPPGGIVAIFGNHDYN
jgi:predicted MPP superfamily phosphohydrolase